MSERVLDSGEQDLRSFYEEEARRRLRTEFRDDVRLEWQAAFVELLRAEGRSSVIDFGAGPGIDGSAFVDAGLRFVGIDLAHGNARLGRERGLHIVHASVSTPPVRQAAFDAGWSISTLMHLPADSIETTVRAMASALAPGSPLQIGVWGGSLGSIVSTFAMDGRPRPFHLRSAEENRELFIAGGSIEEEEVLDLGADGWDYQLFRLRTDA